MANTRLQRGITSALGAALGMAPGMAVVLWFHLASQPVETAAVLLLPVGYIGGIALAVTRRGLTKAWSTAALSAALFIAGVAAVASNDWWRDGPNNNAWGGVILAAISLISALVAGAIMSREPRLAGADRDESTGVGAPDAPESLGADIFRVAMGALVGGTLGLFAGLGIGLIVLLGARMGDFGAGAIFLGIALVGGIIGAIAGMVRATSPQTPSPESQSSDG